VRDLVVVKTYMGLKVQEIILQKVAEIRGEEYRLAMPGEEAKGIDGFVGDLPISIKPETYRQKSEMPETIGCRIVYYAKTNRGLEVDLSALAE